MQTFFWKKMKWIRWVSKIILQPSQPKTNMAVATWCVWGSVCSVRVRCQILHCRWRLYLQCQMCAWETDAFSLYQNCILFPYCECDYCLTPYWINTAWKNYLTVRNFSLQLLYIFYASLACILKITAFMLLKQYFSAQCCILQCHFTNNRRHFSTNQYRLAAWAPTTEITMGNTWKL